MLLSEIMRFCYTLVKNDSEKIFDACVHSNTRRNVANRFVRDLVCRSLLVVVQKGRFDARFQLSTYGGIGFNLENLSDI